MSIFLPTYRDLATSCSFGPAGAAFIDGDVANDGEVSLDMRPQVGMSYIQRGGETELNNRGTGTWRTENETARGGLDVR